MLAETRLHDPFPATGKRDGRVKFAERNWRWELVVQPTEDAGIRRLDVRVFSAADAPLVQLTGFSGKDLLP